MIEEIVQAEAVLTYFVRDSFDVCLSMVRRALASEDLEIVTALDLSRSIERMLGVATPRCTILCVRGKGEREDSDFLPLNVVVSEHENRTGIYVLGALTCDALPAGAADTAAAAQAHITHALDKIAMRQPAFSIC